MLSIQVVPNYSITKLDRNLILLEKTLSTANLFMKGKIWGANMIGTLNRNRFDLLLYRRQTIEALRGQ